MIFPFRVEVNVNVHHHLPDGDGPLRDLMAELKEQLVSALSDAIAALNASADALLARVKTEVDTQAAEITRLQGLVDSGGATPQDIQALADAKAKLDAADPTKPNVAPGPIPAPAPEPAPAP